MTVLAGRGRWPNFGGRRTSRRNVTGINGTAAPGPIPLQTTMAAEYAFDPTVGTPGIITELALGYDPLDNLPGWTRLHDSHLDVNRLVALEIETGRQQNIDMVNPGTARHTFDNSDRQLDPDHAAGDYADLLEPGVRIRDRMVWGSRTYDLYTGFADGFEQRYRPPSVAECNVAASDLLDLLGGQDLPDSSWATTVLATTGLRSWWRLGEPSGSEVAVDAVSGYNGRYFGAPSLEVAALVAATSDKAVTFDGSSAVIGIDSAASLTGDFTVEGWFRRSALGVGVTENLASQWVGISLSDRVGWSLTLGSYGGAYSEGDLVFFVKNISGSIFGVAGVSLARCDDGEIHHFVGTKQGATVALYVDGVLQDTDTLASAVGLAAGSILLADGQTTFPTAVRFGGTLDEIATYDTVLSPATITEHYNAGNAPWSGDLIGDRADRILDIADIAATERDIDRGQVTLGAAELSGSELDYLQTLAVTGQTAVYVDHANGGRLRMPGRTFYLSDSRSITAQAVFTDDPAAPSGYRYEPDDLAVTRDRRLVFNDITVTWTGGEVNRQDTTSRQRYGHRSRSFTTVLTTAAAATTLAEALLAKYKDPVTRVLSLTLRPSADKRLYEPVLNLREGDRVTLRRHPQQIGDAWSKDFIVEGKRWRIGDGINDVTVVLYLSNADAATWFRWNVSAWDGSDVWAA